MKSTVWKRFLKRKSSVIGGIILIIFFLMALFGPFICKIDPNAIDLNSIYAGISSKHYLGTDQLGRDTFARMIYGARTSLFVSFSGVFIGAFIGLSLGVVAGFFGGRVDQVISRAIDILLAFPGLLLAIMVVAVLGSGLTNTIIAIAFYSIPSMARMVRGLVMSLKKREYIQACNLFGESKLRIIITHIIPNCISQIIVDATLSLGTAILTASSLSFLGMGVQPPYAEWGAMLSNAREVIRINPLSALVPGIAITLVVLSFSMMGDGIRDALDPRLKNK